MAQIDHLRELCLRYPETEERTSHGEPAWFAGDKKMFAMFADHHHDDRLACWIAASPSDQQALVATDPLLWFVPPYVGTRGWVGVFLDTAATEASGTAGDAWPQIGEAITDGWQLVASRRLQARYADERATTESSS
jgi:hypothetical protein